eukprot:TRINITY_DN1654_c0_g1_i1.p2 TRINITY_DN1654_c0_g1~~TRINITY_DN1654_c0_g1_i1.p2  ORF type:complete len:226 (-),score=78.24 TRINITY_DN1654_c0_g1_i1:523-1200(-)
MFQIKKKDPIQWRSMRGSPQIDTQLIEAVVNGNISEINNLLNSGGNVDARDITFGRPAICWAKDMATLKVLIAAGANVNGSRDFDSCTALHRAVLAGRVEEAMYLVDDAGADKLAEDISGFTPYDWALELGNEQLAKFLFLPNSKKSQQCHKQEQHKHAEEHKQGQSKQDQTKKQKHQEQPKKQQEQPKKQQQQEHPKKTTRTTKKTTARTTKKTRSKINKTRID